MVYQHINHSPERGGLAAFNRTMKTYAPQQLPLRGIRSWKLLGYVAAVLVFGVTDVIVNFDDWGFAGDGGTNFANQPSSSMTIEYAGGIGDAIPYANFRSALG